MNKKKINQNQHRFLDIIKFETPVEKQMEYIKWLDISKCDQNHFGKVYGFSTVSPNQQLLTYYGISENAHSQVIQATNQLHKLFMNATQRVINDQSLLHKFNIPQILWEQLRHRWNTESHLKIHGRFDFSLSQRGLKVFQYNSQSSGCLMQCGLIQNKWSNTVGVDIGICAGQPLFKSLVDTWKNINDDKIFLFSDSNQEQIYNTLYMKRAIEEAGKKAYIVPKDEMNNLTRDKNGCIYYKKQLIRTVWKTWSWTTILNHLNEQIANNQLQVAQFLRTGKNIFNNSKKVRLFQVMLHPKIYVLEPIWTLIASNKTILPLIYQMFPRCPFILKAQYSLTEQLKKSGYVCKPSNGTSGMNIIMFGNEENVLESSVIKQNNEDKIYQELHLLPKLGENYVQFNSFIVNEKWAGSVLRVDKKSIIDADSCIYALRVISNDLFNKYSQK